MLHDIFFKFPREFPLPFILDGATGTALMKRGMPKGAVPETWVLDNPDVIRGIQLSYAAAGSDAVLAPTFGANGESLRRHGVMTSVEAINPSLAEISRGTAHFIGGDISPTGLFIEPAGDATFDQIARVYSEQGAALRDHVDFFSVETMISLQEARAAVVGLRSVTDKPIFVTITVNADCRTISGDTLSASLLSLSALGINAFGCNCSVGPDDMLRAMKPLLPLAAALGIPLIAKPNAGMPHENDDGSQYYDLCSEEFGEYIPRFYENGIYILGGCCGTDENFIAQIKRCKADSIPDIIPVSNIERLACNNKIIAEYIPCEAISVTDDIADDIDESDMPVPLIRVCCETEADILLENAFMFSLPIALTGDGAAIEKIRRLYNGKVLVL